MHRADQQQLDQLITASVDGVLVLDRDGRVCLANDAACRLLGRPAPEQLVGTQLGYPLLGGQAVELAIASAAGEPTTFVELRGVEIDWDGGRAVLANLRDVSAHRRQQQQLARLNRVLDTIQQTQRLLLRETVDAPTLVERACELIADKNGSYEHASIVLWDGEGSVTSVTEYPKGSCGRAMGAEKVHDLPCTARCADGATEGDVLESCQGCPLALSGGIRRLVVPLVDGQRTLGCINAATASAPQLLDRELELLSALAADIARALSLIRIRVDRDAAERALAASEHTLLETGRMARVGGWGVDADTRRVSWSQVTREIFELPADANPKLEHTLRDFFLPTDRERLGRAIDAALDKGTAYAFTMQIRTYLGNERWVDTRCEPMIEDGEVVRLRGTLQDVTERQQLGQQLQHAQRLDSVGRLAGGVAHDFNNLLTAIFSFGGFVLEELEPGSEAHGDMTEVLKAARRAESLTRQLLAFSRRRAITPVVLDVNEHVRELDKMLRRLIGEHIIYSLDLTHEPATVRMDVGALQSVLINLAVNARDAMDVGGELEISTRVVTHEQPRDIGGEEPLAAGRYCEIVVADGGVGMSEDTCARAFEPFFTTKQAGRGTGLGLSTCYGLVKQAGGAVVIDSALGKGTRVHVLLPEAAERPAARPTGDSVAVQAGGEVLLLVDDDDAIRRACKRVLGDIGYAVVAAAEGAAALELAKAHQPALLITDVVMPKMSGLQLAERMQSLSPQTKVLYMSGYSEGAVGARGEMPADVDLLQKPFTADELAARVRRALDD